VAATGVLVGAVAGWRVPEARRAPSSSVASIVEVSGSFAIAGVASYFVPGTGDIVDLAAANFTTVIGALCFLAGAVGLLVEGTHTRLPTLLVPAVADAAISPTGMTPRSADLTRRAVQPGRRVLHARQPALRAERQVERRRLIRIG
jgi:hypothetical protein